MLESTKSPFLKGKIIIYLPRCRSTNSEIIQLCHDDPHAVDILALYTDEQTHGRGQRGNSWSMSAGKQLAISVLVPYEKKDEPNLVWLPIGVAHQIMRYLLNLNAFATVQIKWPNDIYVNGKKIGGILTETVKPENGRQYAVVGIGLNIFQTEDVVTLNGISLEAIDVLCDKTAIRHAILHAVDQAASILFTQSISDTYLQQMNAALLYIHQRVVCFDSENKTVEGEFLGLDRQGCFCVKTPSGTVRLPHHLWSSPRHLPEYLPE